MNDDLGAVLTALCHEVQADVAVIWWTGRQRVLTSSMPGVIGEGAEWLFDGPSGALDAGGLAALPTALRLEFPSAPEAGLVTTISTKPDLRLLLVWCQPPDGDLGSLTAAALASGLGLAARAWARYRQAEADRARLDAMNATLKQGVVTTDDIAGTADVNAAAAALLHLTAGQHPIGTVSSALGALRMTARNVEHIERAAQSLRVHPEDGVPEVIWEFDGHPSHVAVSSTPFSSQGAAGRVWVFDDVSSHVELAREASQARQAQALSDERFRIAMTHAGLGIAVVSGAGEYLEVNEALGTIAGRAPADLLGSSWRDITHPEDLADVTKQFMSLRSGARDSVHARARLLRPDGDYVWVDLSVAVVRTASGDPRYYVNHLRDISTEVAAEQVLLQEHALLRTVSDGVIDPLVLLQAVRDEVGEIVDLTYAEVNRATTKYLGLDRTALIGKSILETLPNLKASGLLARYVQAIETGQPLLLSDFVFDNEVIAATRRYDISAVASGDSLSLTWRDVTERFETSTLIAESEERFRLLAENSTDVVLRVTLDGIIEWASPSALSALGWSPEDLVGMRNLDLVHPDDLPWFTAEARRVAQTGSNAAFTIRTRRADGDYLWMESAGAHVDGVGDRPAFRIVRLRDVDAQVTAFRELARSEERFRAALASAPTGVAILGLERQLQQVNPALCRLLDRPQEWLLQHELGAVLHPDDDAADLQQRADLLARGLPHTTHQSRLLRADGSEVWVEHAVGVIRDEAGEPVSFVSQFMDITASKQAREALQFLAEHDPLTDVKNRRGIVTTIASVLSHPPRTGTRLGVLFCDVDGLKPVNDTWGHAVGDAVLVEVARRLRRAVRSGDHVGRLGGDEFVVLLTSLTSEVDGLRVAEKLRHLIAQPFDVEGRRTLVTISIGLRVADPGEDPDEVLQQADAAVYEAKAAGRNRVVVYGR